MFKLNKKYLIAAFVLGLSSLFYFFKTPSSTLPLVAIANYGPHASLEESIRGLKEELTRQGFIENQNIRYEVANVGFDTSLLAQMISNLKGTQPQVMVAITTPVAQTAKNLVKNIPLVFSTITDPVEAGLLQQADQPEANMTGASEKPDLGLLLAFVKKLIPQARKMGVLYASGEANDAALVKMLSQAALQANLEIVPISVDQARDVPVRMQAFKGVVDFIYVGTSGPIQPALPAISAQAAIMGIPVFNADSTAVKNHEVLGSFGVDFYQIGGNAGKLVARILAGEKVGDLKPLDPRSEDHHGFISRQKAQQLHIKIPPDLKNTTIVE